MLMIPYNKLKKLYNVRNISLASLSTNRLYWNRFERKTPDTL